MTGILRRRLGNRVIGVVATLVGLSIAVLVGFSVLVARSVDADSAHREQELVRAGLASLQMKMQSELASFAHWEETVDRTASKADWSWVHRSFGLRLWETSGHARSFIFDSEGQPIYASIEGVRAPESIYEASRDAFEPILAELRQAYVAATTTHMLTAAPDELASPPEAQFVAAFRRVEDRPALIGAITIVPRMERTASRGYAPAIAASVSFLDRRLLKSLSNEWQINGLELHAGPIPEDRTGVELPLAAGEQPAFVVWTPRRPGTAMLKQLLPALLAIAGVIGIATGLVLLFIRNMTRRLAQSEDRASELAYRDSLTGLANRVQLLETLSERLAEMRPGNRYALFLIDLDGFKDVNDMLGHAVGDELLFAIGERLTSVVGERGMTVRFGGDEFALLVPIGESKEEISLVCRRVTDAMRVPVIAGEHLLNVDATIGVAVAPDDANDPEQLLRRADIALYRAKAEARGSYRLFDPSFEEILHRRGLIERELARALEQNELAVKFQPILSGDGERVVGAEALLRWNHPERGLVPPSEFVPIAEQSGLVVKLDEWVLRKACECAAAWPGLSLAVNLSATNFRQSDVAERLKRVLFDTGFDPRRLEIEITESMLLGANADVLGELSELRRMGVRIALDDFGTGYSSLGYLRRFPVDKIKIDKSFVQNLGVTEDAAAIVECVTRLGRALGLAVTAEGVETREQHRFVRAAGCHQVQGYLFSPPVDAAAIGGLLRPERTPLRGRRTRLASA